MIELSDEELDIITDLMSYVQYDSLSWSDDHFRVCEKLESRLWDEAKRRGLGWTL